MKKQMILLLCLLSTSLIAQEMLPFYWLVGTWQMPTRNGSIVHEVWSMKNDSTLQEISYIKKQNGDSIATETVELILRNGAVSYNSTVKNQNASKAVEFKMTSTHDDIFIFENPSHDFPKKITYRFVRDSNKLFARIEGAGKQRDFNYTKTPQYKTLTQIEGKDTFNLKPYFICLLKTGANRSHSKEEAAKIQSAHLAHLGHLYKIDKINLAGPFGDNGDIRGITVFNVSNIEEAIWWASQDPAVKAGRLIVEVHPWWTAVGGTLK